MKKILILICSLVFSLSLFSQTLEEALVLKPNLEVKMGELTGAGTRFSIKALAGFVHPNGYIMKEDCTKIMIKQSVDPKVSDVVQITVNGSTINSSELTGFIIQK